MKKIKFGTDGWRAVIARDFTFENVARVAAAAAAVMREKRPDRNGMVVGYDRRFLARAFAECVATVYARAGYDVKIAPAAMPTPVFSWCAKNLPGMAGATVITASHNPPEWSGFKFKESFGGSALPQTTEAFERRIARDAGAPVPVPTDAEYAAFARGGKIAEFDPMRDYLAAIARLVDVELIRRAKFRVAIDTMHGAGSAHLAAFLGGLGVEARAIHTDDNPGFGGTAPEPVEKNLAELCALVKDGKFACGFATDGDADRLGAVDENGAYFSTQKILSTVYWHMLEHRKKPWSIARSASTTNLVDLIAKARGFECYETPVGFKHIAEKIVEGRAHIGGEESGGIGIVDHIPERDSFLTCLLLLEAMAMRREGLASIYAHIGREHRPYEFVRLDLTVPDEVMARSMKRLETQAPKAWLGRAVEVLSTLDGFKFYMKDGSWLLIRPSGTEPIFRLYADTESLEASQKMVEAAREFVMSS